MVILDKPPAPPNENKSCTFSHPSPLTSFFAASFSHSLLSFSSFTLLWEYINRFRSRLFSFFNNFNAWSFSSRIFSTSALHSSVVRSPSSLSFFSFIVSDDLQGAGRFPRSYCTGCSPCSSSSLFLLPFCTSFSPDCSPSRFALYAIGGVKGGSDTGGGFVECRYWWMAASALTSSLDAEGTFRIIVLNSICHILLFPSPRKGSNFIVSFRCSGDRCLLA
mmetsp:Transcript_24500/g.52998  ORF Transcript_24500/g.52998 Transcript_24500/m.52998 type:complete len:220 (-) Transcript_24500:605-1264(-)